jgi:hypothetical protein
MTKFMTHMLDTPSVCEMFLELLIECPDNIARGNASHTLKVVLCKLKVLEKDSLINNEQETVIFNG